MANGVTKCLIVERHNWETGGGEQQLQIPLSAAHQFFGPGNRKRPIRVDVFVEGGARQSLLSGAPYRVRIETELAELMASKSSENSIRDLYSSRKLRMPTCMNFGGMSTKPSSPRGSEIGAKLTIRNMLEVVWFRSRMGRSPATSTESRSLSVNHDGVVLRSSKALTKAPSEAVTELERAIAAWVESNSAKAMPFRSRAIVPQTSKVVRD